MYNLAGAVSESWSGIQIIMTWSPNHAPGGLILRRALRPSSPDDDSSVAKASAAVFSDALAALVIMAFLPMQGADALACCPQL